MTNNNKFEQRVEKYTHVIEDIFKEKADTELLRRVVEDLGPSIYFRDSERVAMSRKAEMATVHKFLKDKLRVTADDDREKGIVAVLGKYKKEDRNKYRAVLYYQLIRHFKKEALFDPGAGDGSSPARDGDGGSTTGGPGSGGGRSKEGDRKVQKVPRPLFIDAKEAEDAARLHLERELRNLKIRDEKGKLSKDEKRKLEFLRQILEGVIILRGEPKSVPKPGYALDDTYVALREHLGHLFRDNPVPGLADGHFGDAETVDDMDENDIATAAVWAARSLSS